MEHLEQLGLDPRYVGWLVSTTINTGNARISGVEFNIRHSLRGIGTWGSYFDVFLNGTKLELQGSDQAAFTSSIPKSLNWGFTFSRKPVTFVARWNYMGGQRGALVSALGPDVYTYNRFPRATVDVNLDWQFRKKMTLFAGAKNLEELPRLQLRYGSNSPAYARQLQVQSFGVIFNVGLKNSF